jgi:hypothetical protein
MRCKNLFIALAVAVALIAPLAAASTVTLTGGCPTYTINSIRNYILFNVTNSGDGAASDLSMSVNFPGINSSSSTQTIQNVAPNSSYSRRFYLSSIPGQGSYAVNVNATYAQAGSSYATVFPCIVYVGSLAGGPLVETASVSGNRLYINVTNTASQEISANVTAVVPAAFKVSNPTKAIQVAPNGKAGIYFDVVAPSYTDASFPLIGELSYEYGSSHYAQMASAALVFSSGGAAGSGGGIGLVGWGLVVIVIIILALIAVSIFVRVKGKGGKSQGSEGVSE